jgi:phage terminase large subunit
VTAQFPDKLQCLFDPHRYKALWGGRGGAKSWGIARALLILAASRPGFRVLCAREYQKSIADSVHQLLKEQIVALGLESKFRILENTIIGPGGGQFIFAGLHHNIANIKSIESVDVAWVEEAQTVSKSSWEVLIPTIRKEGSEIWVSFNPELETDDTYKRFVVNPPPGAVVVKIGYRDNPWFPEVLKAEAEHLKAKDPDAYNHVWEGCCRTTLEGAVYAEELRKIDAEGRILRVPYDPTKPVDTFWDLGFGDNTSIWFAQSVGFEIRLIDFLSDCQKGLQYYLKALQGKPYVFGGHYLPHDARAHELGTGKTIEEQMRAAGFKVSIVRKISITDGIAAARAVLPRCYFDAEKCADGIQALRHYRYERDENLGTFKREPLHDWASHPADSFRYLAVEIKEPQKIKAPSKPVSYPVGQWS